MIALVIVVLSVWLVLPFLPALAEAYRQRDSAPLAISDRYREDRRQGPHAGAPAHAGETATGDAWSQDHAWVAANALAEAGPDASGAVAQSFTGAPGLRVSELRVRGVARLGAGTTVARRLIVGDSAEVGAGSVLHGSAEAGDVLWLGPGCRFERVHAPAVCTGAPRADDLLDGPALPELPRQPAAPFSLPDGAEVLAGRALVVGDLSLPTGARYTGDLVVRGDLSLGEGARIRGSVKARGDIRLAAGAVVTANAVADGDVTLDAHASVGGAALAGGRLTLGEGARVGRPSAPSSATGREVTLADDVTVYGTVWARERGETLRAA